MGNIHSILKALRLYHPDVEYTADAGKIGSCLALVLPGDGAFAAAMEGLAPMKDLIHRHVENGRPLLGVCIGFQVLFADSSECDAGVVPGLGLLEGRVRKFNFEDRSVRVPHMGWNRLVSERTESPGYLSQYMYFIHSYRAENVRDADVLARCDYAGDIFPAAIQHESILACQFHPEKSSEH